jgi:transposase
VLLRLAYLTVTNTFAVLRLLPMSDRAKDVEILALRHQLAVLQRQLGPSAVTFTPVDRALLAALLQPLPRSVLRRMRLVVRPDTVLRLHRNLMKQRHAHLSKRKRRGPPPTVRSIRILVLRLARENPSWGYRRIHGELATLGIKVAASTVWAILKAEGIDPAPHRSTSTWADFLRSQAHALLAVDFIETITLTGQRANTFSPSSNTPPDASGSWSVRRSSTPFSPVRILALLPLRSATDDTRCVIAMAIDVDTWVTNRFLSHRPSSPRALPTCTALRTFAAGGIGWLRACSADGRETSNPTPGGPRHGFLVASSPCRGQHVTLSEVTMQCHQQTAGRSAGDRGGRCTTTKAG